jgi:hypothetical protein
VTFRVFFAVGRVRAGHYGCDYPPMLSYVVCYAVLCNVVCYFMSFVITCSIMSFYLKNMYTTMLELN